MGWLMLREAQKIKMENLKFYYGRSYAHWITKRSYQVYQFISVIVFALVMLRLKWELQESRFYRQAFYVSTNGREVRDWVLDQMRENYFDISTWAILSCAALLLIYLILTVKRIPSYELYKQSVLIHIGPLTFAGVGAVAFFLSEMYRGDLLTAVLYWGNELAIVLVGKLLSTLGARKDSSIVWKALDIVADLIIRRL